MNGATPASDDVVYHPRFGPALPSRGWVPAPRYLLRRTRALSHIREIAPASILDVGCGPGAMLAELDRQGIECHGLETSPAALAVGRVMHRRDSVQLHDRPSADWREKFDLVTAFEVLEHIEQDVDALRQWCEWIKPGGHLIISVPAHPILWNARDVWAGHVRRYTRAELTQKISRADLGLVTLECYGFPVANILEIVSAVVHRIRLKNGKNSSSADMAVQTANSGTDRSLDLSFWHIFSMPPVATTFDIVAKVQNLTLGTNLGNGFILVARKSLR